MRGKTTFAVPVSPTRTMIAGAEFEVVCENGDYYSCRFFTTGDIVCLHKNSVIITDCTPTINWEQRRYELAKEVLPRLIDRIKPGPSAAAVKFSCSDAAKTAIDYADALIEELKK